MIGTVNGVKICLAKRIVDLILNDLKSRRGIDGALSDIDPTIYEEMVVDLNWMVLKEIAAYPG